MDVEEVRKKKHELSMRINEMINRFEFETGTELREIRVCHAEWVRKEDRRAEAVAEVSLKSL